MSLLENKNQIKFMWRQGAYLEYLFFPALHLFILAVLHWLPSRFFVLPVLLFSCFLKSLSVCSEHMQHNALLFLFHRHLASEITCPLLCWLSRATPVARSWGGDWLINIYVLSVFSICTCIHFWKILYFYFFLCKFFLKERTSFKW